MSQDRVGLSRVRKLGWHVATTANAETKNALAPDRCCQEDQHARSVTHFLVGAAGIIGVAEAFIYASHLFYNVSGARNRSGLMALHEFLLSAGLVAGSLSGGYISDAFGRYKPYWFGLLMVSGAIMLQGIIGAVVKKTD
jgi:hypothetical protein